MREYIKHQITNKLEEKVKKIKTLIIDIDGVLTDGRIIYSNSGDELKNFDVHDGFGMVLLRRAGIKTIVITANKSRLVLKRSKMLGVVKVYQNAVDKLETFQKIIKSLKLNPEEICYIGDDLIDIPVLKKVGFAVAVPNAISEVKRSVHYVTEKKGGHGAVREISDMILKTAGKWDSVTAKYFR